jgi:TonB family protein
MKRSTIHFFAVVTVAVSLLNIGHAQDKQTPEIVRAPLPAAPDNTVSLPPLADPATPDQIREYLRLSGDMDSFRAKWIAAVDKNRSIGAPYWPEAFWTDLKAEMQKTDLMPIYITLFQHEISRELMQRVLDAYKRLGAVYFKGSLEYIELGEAELSMKADMNKLKLAKTLEVINKVYAITLPETEAARVRYMAVPANNSSGAEAGSETTPADDGQIKSVGGGVSAPVAIKQVQPQFSEEARQKKMGGTVTVYLIVDQHGLPQNVHVTRGVGMGLDENAVEAVKQYRFKPAMENGKPVAVYLNVEVLFAIFDKNGKRP